MTHPNRAIWRNREWRITVGVCLALAAITWFVFGQTLHFAFVNYDDPEWVSENPNVTGGLSTRAALWALTHMQAGPLASISHMLDFDLYGLNPWGHHFTNVLLHTVAVLLLFVALREMTGGPSSPRDESVRLADRTGNVWRGAFVAALFAIHPLRVESVAWVTERKDVLSGIFFMLTLIAYVCYVRRPSLGRYLAVTLAFTLGLLSKGILVMLPLVLLLLDYWPLQRPGSRPSPNWPPPRWSRRAPAPEAFVWMRLIVEKIPLFALSAAAAATTFLTHSRALGSVEAVPLSLRLSNAFVSFIIYIQQMFYPAGLTPFYGFTHRPLWQVTGSIVLLIGVTAVVILWRRQHPYLLTGWFWYLAMLAPVSGIVQAGLQGHADRYTYLPHIGLYLIVVWGIADLARHWRFPRPALAAGAAIVLGSLAVSAWHLAASWRASESLWTRALAVAPQNDFAHASLADLLLRQGRMPEAISHAEAALKINANNADAHNNLALAISRRGRLAEAVAHWNQSLKIHPENLNARTNLAWVLATAPDASLRNGSLAVELAEPVARATGNSNVVSLQILGAAYAESGRFDEAIRTSRQAWELAVKQGNSPLADSLLRSIASYEANQPVRDETLVSANVPPPALARPR
jgi:cytochrome c-type biogenesis protein CcmH/NrfG